MTGPEVIDIVQAALWTLFVLCAPIMISGLVIGVAVALFQALTGIQEASLTFVPKLVVMSVVFLLCLPLMGSQMSSLMETIVDRIIVPSE